LWAVFVYNSVSGSAFRKESTTLPANSTRTEQLQTKTLDLKRAIGALGEIFPGSLVQRFRKCGKPSCHCAKKDSKGHGPDWIVTRELHGKTVTKAIPEPAVEQVRAGTEEYKRFRQLSHELIETSAQLGEMRLQSAESDEGTKKNRARRRVRD
jgi:uncharacterized protein DUF6788